MSDEDMTLPMRRMLKKAVDLYSDTPKPSAPREWYIHHEFGCSGISGPDTQKITVVDRAAYEALEKELDDARHVWKQTKAQLDTTAMQFISEKKRATTLEARFEHELFVCMEAERAKSAKLVEALKRECCCPGERNLTPPYDFIKCDACEALAEYAKDSPTESMTYENALKNRMAGEITGPTESRGVIVYGCGGPFGVGENTPWRQNREENKVDGLDWTTHTGLLVNIVPITSHQEPKDE